MATLALSVALGSAGRAHAGEVAPTRLRIESDLWRLNGDTIRQPLIPLVQKLEVPVLTVTGDVTAQPDRDQLTALTVGSDLATGATLRFSRTPGRDAILVPNPTNRFDPFTGEFTVEVHNGAGRASGPAPWTASLPLDLTTRICLDATQFCFFSVDVSLPQAVGQAGAGPARFQGQVALLSFPVRATAFPEDWTTGRQTVRKQIITHRRFGDPAGTPTGFRTFAFTATGSAGTDRLSFVTPVVVDELWGAFQDDPPQVPAPASLVGFLRATFAWCDRGPNSDGDAWRDACDNCPHVANDDQKDSDRDGIGNLCECGDVSGDGFLQSTDARLIRRCAVGEIPCGARCDVNGDGACNTTDARLVQRVVVGELPKTVLRCPERP